MMETEPRPPARRPTSSSGRRRSFTRCPSIPATSPRPGTGQRLLPIVPFNAETSPPSPLSPVSPDTSRQSTQLFTLPSADDVTYTSIVKSDICQLNSQFERMGQELEKLRRSSFERGPPLSRPGSAMSSRSLAAQGDELLQMDSKDQVDRILLQCSDSQHRKLKLLEHLSGRMVNMEVLALKMTQRHAEHSANGSSSKSTNLQHVWGAPSLSRLPSFIALIDRVYDLHKQLDSLKAHVARTQGSSPTSNIVSVSSSSGDCKSDLLDDLEENVRMLQGDLGLKDTIGSERQSSDDRVRALTDHIESIRERGVYFLHKEIEELQKTNRDMAGAIHKLKTELQTRSSETDQSSQTEVVELRKSLQQAAESARAFKINSDQKLQQLQDLLEGTHKELNEVRAHATAQVEQLSQQVSQLQHDLQHERAARDQEGQESQDDIAAVRREVEDEQRELEQECETKTVELSRLSALVAQKEHALAQLSFTLEDERSCLNQHKKSSAEQERNLTQMIDSLEKRLAESTSRCVTLTTISSSTATPEVQELQVVIQSLQREVTEANATLERTRRSHAMLETYSKEALDKREQELNQTRTELRTAKLDLAQNIQMHEQLAVSAEAHTKRLQRSIQSLLQQEHKQLQSEDDHTPPISSFDEMVREEMRVMKGAFEVKINSLREELSKKTLEFSQQQRSLNEALDSERHSHSITSAKLRAKVGNDDDAAA